MNASPPPTTPPNGPSHDSAPPPASGVRQRGFRIGWAEAMVLVGVLTLAMGAFVAFYVVRQAANAGRTALDTTTRAAQAAADTAVEMARAFRQGSVTTSFASYATEVSGSSYLQFATLDQTEIFERKDSASVLWGQLDLPDIVVEARAPVSYTYYLDLSKEWSFELVDDALYVSAPPSEFNRPAVDASRLSSEVRESSVLRDADDAVEKLRRGITPMLRRRAASNVELVREIGRRRTEEFITGWLMREFGEPARDLDVEVRFADESPAPRLERRLEIATPDQR